MGLEVLLHCQKGLPFTNYRIRKGVVAILIDVVAQAPTIVSKLVGKCFETVEQFVTLMFFCSYLDMVTEHWLFPSDSTKQNIYLRGCKDHATAPPGVIAAVRSEWGM